MNWKYLFVRVVFTVCSPLRSAKEIRLKPSRRIKGVPGYLIQYILHFQLLVLLTGIQKEKNNE